MVENYVDSIFDELSTVVPNNWEKIIFHAEIEEKHFSMFYYVKCNAKYYQCFELCQLCDIDVSEIVNVYKRINAICLKENDKEWIGFDLVINKDLSFEISYNYSYDFDENLWKKKYLK